MRAFAPSTPRRVPSRRRRRQHRSGMTLVEIMVVMTIIAIVAGALSVAVLPNLRRAKIKQTSADAKTIASAAELYISESDDCPSVDDLISSKQLKQSAGVKDQWDNDFAIECNEDGAIVRSAGPDEQMGTDDDIE